MGVKLWKLFFGNFERELPGEMCWKNYVPGGRRTIVSIAGQRRVFGRIFFRLRGEIDSEWVFIDGSYIRAHQHASGARHGEERAIRRSRGEPTTEIHIAADAYGNLIDFEITGGEVHDAKTASQAISKVNEAENLMADKGYDSVKEEAARPLQETLTTSTTTNRFNEMTDDEKKLIRDQMRELNVQLENLGDSMAGSKGSFSNRMTTALNKFEKERPVSAMVLRRAITEKDQLLRSKLVDPVLFERLKTVDRFQRNPSAFDSSPLTFDMMTK